ncbi:MAG: hypothetical protein NT162_00560 [Candidatus Woesebacteria bacterium]|nr:hypothetical protein [Candidatus Woesebacteria bacterium]
MNTAKQAGQSAKNLAQQIARQIAQEPLEVLKEVGSQVTGNEQDVSRQEVGPLDNKDAGVQKQTLQNQQKIQDKMESTRRMEALNQELQDIHKQDLFKDLQNKIAQGVEVPIADYVELSMEQKQVLKAQMEAVRYQKQQAAYNESQNGAPLIVSKPSRRFGAAQRGQKAEAEKQQTRVERPVPPSG